MKTNKIYFTIKTGYSAGSHGCTAEYFTTVYIDDQGAHLINHKGLYGSEYRVGETLASYGYKCEYSSYTAVYGQVKGDNKRYALSEKDAIQKINDRLNEK